MEWMLSVIIVGSALIHGGFYPEVGLMCGVMCAVAVLFIKRPWPGRAGIALICFDVWYIGSSIVNGYDAYSLSRAFLPLCATMTALCAGTLSDEGRRRLFDNILTASGVMALIGMAALSGIIPIGTAAASGRLQFPFEYANALGAWLGAAVMIGWKRHGRCARLFRLPMITALILTGSVGAVGLYVLIWAARVLFDIRERGEWKDLVIIHALAVVFAAALHFASAPLALLVLPALLAASWYTDRLLGCAKRLGLHYILPLIGCAGLFLLLPSERLHEAVGTFAERLAQISDGMAMIADHPAFGVGAGNWERVYTRYQSAQYRSSVIHSSIVGFGVDGGIPAMVMFAIFVIFECRTKGREPGENAGVALLLGHSLMDFDLTFYPILVLTLILLHTGERDAVSVKKDRTIKIAAVPAAISMVFLLCANGLTERLDRYTYLGEWPKVISTYEKYGWIAGGNAENRRLCAGAYYITGSFEETLELLADPETYDELDTGLAAQALKNAGRIDEAFELYLDQLEGQIRNVRLFDAARGFLTANDAPSEYIRRYNRIVKTANITPGHFTWMMGDQVQIGEIPL